MKSITIEIPEKVVPHSPREAEELNRDIRHLAMLIGLDRGRISRDEAAEIVGVDRADVDAAIVAWHEAARALKGQAMPAAEPPFDQQCDPEEADAQYRVLGAWKGPAARSEVQQAAKAFWRGAGSAGARWLVDRLRNESHVDALHGASSMLADIRESSLIPILEGLRRDPSVDQAIALLRALGWIGEAQQTDDPRAEAAIVDFLFHEEPDVREAADAALCVVPPDRAAHWRARRLRVEQNQEVSRSILWRIQNTGDHRE